MSDFRNNLNEDQKILLASAMTAFDMAMHDQFSVKPFEEILSDKSALDHKNLTPKTD